MLMSFVVISTLSSFVSVYGQVLQVDVWTNKGGQGFNNLNGGNYVYSETTYIYFSVNLDAERVRLIIIFPDGSQRVVIDRPLPAGTYSYVGVISGIPGVRIAKLEVWSGGQYAYDEVRYNAVFCPSHSMYLGVDIRILSDEDVEITGWFKPTRISWRDFVDLCWNVYPGRDYYISYLRNDLLNPMFGIKQSSTLGSGLDEAGNKVWLRLSVKLRDLSHSDHELKILRFIDPIKRAGRGFIDEIRLTSFRESWKAIPPPTKTERWPVDGILWTAEWINRDAASAPLNYEVYLHPLISIKVRVEGIPPSTSVSILINEADVGSVSPERYLEKTLISGDYTIRVQPDTIMYNEYVRYRCKNNAYRLTDSGEIVFRYNAEYRVKIFVQSPAGGAGLTIDGSYYNFEQLPFEDWWEDKSTHRIIADREGGLIEVSEVERKIARFYGWNDGTSIQEKTMSIAGPLNLIALYNLVTQYYVKVKSDYAKAIGSGWYDEGEQINIRLEGHVPEGQKAIFYLSNKERMVFQGWSGDLTSQNIEEILTVNSPKFIEAVWKKQYYVETITNYSHIEGSGWYYEGDAARIALAEDVIYTPDRRTRYVFDRWRGDYTGFEKELSIIVNKPLIIEAVWFIQYRVELYTDPAELADKALEFRERWFTSGDLLSTSVKNEIQVSSDVKYVFARWITDNEISPSSEIRKIVDKPMRISVEYDPWYYISAISEYGVVYGSGWYKAKSQASISIEPQTMGFLITHVFDGWFLNGELISKDAVCKLTVDRPLILTARWRTEYTGLIVLIMAIVLGSVIISTNLIKVGEEPLYRTLYNVIKGKLAELLKLQTSERRLKEKLRKLEELYQRGEISEEAYVRIRGELESELMRRKPPKK
ncbi:MAG: SHOCT domain-containing protein [Candidatus Bathyarchaeia archaeon]